MKKRNKVRRLVEKPALSAVPAADIAVTINGGKREVDSATLPIEWWLSERVIDREPKFVLIFEQDEKEKINWHSTQRGRRYVCDLHQAVKFVQVFSPGYHRVMVAVFEDSKPAVKGYLETEESGRYSRSLNWEVAELDQLTALDGSILASAVVEIEVPSELFAQAPKTRWGKLVWRWVNLWYEDDPVDECNYRQRKGFAFTIQPFLALIWWALKFLVGGTIYATYVLCASIITFFFGYRPKPIIKEMWGAFTWQRSDTWSVKRYTNGIFGFSSTYCVWHITERWPQPPVTIMMPVAPWVVAVIGAILYGLYRLLALLEGAVGMRALLVAIVVLLFVSAISYVFFVRYFNKAEVQRRQQLRESANWQRKLAEQEAERKWLSQNLGLARYKSSVDLADIPIRPGVEGKVQRLYVGFWTLKAQICKPFSR